MRLQGSAKAPTGTKPGGVYAKPAKHRSGQNKTAKEGRRNWKHVRQEKDAAKEQTELANKVELWEEKEKQARLQLAFQYFCHAWSGCTSRDAFSPSWETAKRRFPVWP